MFRTAHVPFAWSARRSPTFIHLVRPIGRSQSQCRKRQQAGDHSGSGSASSWAVAFLALAVGSASETGHSVSELRLANCCLHRRYGRHSIRNWYSDRFARQAPRYWGSTCEASTVGADMRAHPPHICVPCRASGACLLSTPLPCKTISKHTQLELRLDKSQRRLRSQKQPTPQSETRTPAPLPTSAACQDEPIAKTRRFH